MLGNEIGNEGGVRRNVFVLCFWVIASRISTCNANMPAGQMRFLALSLRECQGETHDTEYTAQQQHKWNQPNPPPHLPILYRTWICLGFQLWSECVRVYCANCVENSPRIIFICLSLGMNLRLFSAPFLDPLALSVVAFMRNCFFASQRGQFIVCDSLLGVLEVCVCVYEMWECRDAQQQLRCA